MPVELARRLRTKKVKRGTKSTVVSTTFAVKKLGFGFYVSDFYSFINRLVGYPIFLEQPHQFSEGFIVHFNFHNL